MRGLVCSALVAHKHVLTFVFPSSFPLLTDRVPPKEVVEKLHKAGIPCMNMVGHPKHVQKALDVGMDLICAQGWVFSGYFVMHVLICTDALALLFVLSFFLLSLKVAREEVTLALFPSRF